MIIIKRGQRKRLLLFVLKVIFLFPARANQAWIYLVKILKPSWSDWFNENLESINKFELKKKIKHSSTDNVDIEIQVMTPNSICIFRANTFSSKEPETLEWIDKFGKNGVFYDVGANIGLYSLYYAKKYASQTYAFEPSVFNLELLAKNVALNNLEKFITICPISISDKTANLPLYLSNTQLGAAHNSFGTKIGHDGLDIKPKFEYNSLGFTLDFLVDNLIIKLPTMMKVDVDGIEDLILHGALNLLKHPHLKTILIEVNYDYLKSAEQITNLLEISGFLLASKNQSIMFQNSVFKNTYNTIWVRREI